MPELTYDHKLSLGDVRHVADKDVFSGEITPPAVTEVIQAFAAELSPLPPMHVSWQQDDWAVYGWPAAGVEAKMGIDGGSIRYGWRVREWPRILLTAEPHAVWVDPDGTLIDITPDVADGEDSLFVPMPEDAEPINFDQRPANRYHILYHAVDPSEAVAERIARMKPPQRAYEERRAHKAGKTLNEWMLDKHHNDPLPGQLAAFIAACDAFDAKLPTLPELIAEDPDAEPEDDLSDDPQDGVETSSADEAAEPVADLDADSESDVADDDDLDLGDPGDIDVDDIDDIEEFDVTWLAARTLNRWSLDRERRRDAIFRTLAGL
jgi:hypothetical protein